MAKKVPATIAASAGVKEYFECSVVKNVTWDMYQLEVF